MTHPPSSHRRQVVINDPLGLHLRPAAKLAILARSFRSDIRVLCRGATADARSLLDLVLLAAETGTALEIVAQGPDAEQAVAALSHLIVGGFGGAAVQEAAAA